MTICNGCGGVVGRDCFNPAECEWIAYSQEQQRLGSIERNRKTDKQEIELLKSKVISLENDLSELRQIISRIDERTIGLVPFGPLK